MYYCSDGSCRKMYLHFMCSDGTNNAFEEDPAIFTFQKGLYCRLGLLQNLLLVLVVQVVPGKWEKPDIRCFTCLYNAITTEKYRHVFLCTYRWPWLALRSLRPLEEMEIKCNSYRLTSLVLHLCIFLNHKMSQCVQ